MIDDRIPIETLRRSLQATEARLAETEAHVIELSGELAMVRRDLQHRMRNTLATVRSIARRSAERSITVQDYQLHLDGRLAAIGRVQGALFRDPATGVDLEGLVADELAICGRQPAERWKMSGASKRLRPRAAEVMGLAIHELVINATKFGALSRSDGRIAIGWFCEDADEGQDLVFDWIESGVEIKPSTHPIRGFGSEVIEEAIPYQLDGVTLLNLAREGLRCRIRLPDNCLFNDVQLGV